MHYLARDRIGMASEKIKTRYDARATGHDFHEDEKVWLWNPKRRKGLSSKLQTNWEGRPGLKYPKVIADYYGTTHEKVINCSYMDWKTLQDF
ncbi:kinectin [Trichonephila clavipes]|nr:kinectin [Trichonephila clavipes]